VTLPIRILPEASAELTEAVRWYEAKRRGLGRDLLHETAKVVDRLEENPRGGTPMSADQRTRRLLVSRFPYQVVYRLRPDEIVVVAVAHLKRRPGYWKDR
jgi:plasmid stabilization system protein ParE